MIFDGAVANTVLRIFEGLDPLRDGAVELDLTLEFQHVDAHSRTSFEGAQSAIVQFCSGSGRVAAS